MLKGAAYTVAFVVVGVVGFSIAALYFTKKSPRVDPSHSQHEMIVSAQEVICNLDADMCGEMKIQNLAFKVIELPQFLDMGRAFYWSHYAVTHKKEPAIK